MIIGTLVLQLFVFVLVVAFAFLYRNRGMAHAATWDGTTVNRLLSWELPVMIQMTVTAYLYHMPLWLGAISGALAFGGILLGHSFAQNAGATQYPQMGLVNSTRLAAIMLPFFVADVHYHTMHRILWCLPLISFFVFWGASALAYNVFNTKTLKLFGTTWCSPGGSEWEELFNGAGYGLFFALIIIDHYLRF